MDTKLEKEQQLKEKVSTKLFLGCCITSEIRMQLSQNPKWQRITTLAAGDGQQSFIELRYKDKDYFGKFLEESHPPLSLLQLEGQAICAAIEQFCPLTKADRLTIVIFPQVFLF